MKKLFIAVLLGGLALQQSALSQTGVVETNPTPPIESVTNPPAAADVAVTNQPSVAAESSPPAVAAEAAATNPPSATTGEQPASPATNAPAVTAVSTESAGVTATNPPSATTVEPAVSPTTNAPAVPVSSIPLIQFQDVPLTTAIENLARQAGINYLLDPKIGYGQPDQNGQIKPEPTLSIRWQNVTAEQALLALLDNYGLQMVLDKKTGIARITLKDPTAPPPLITRVVQLKYSSVSNISVAVQSVFTDRRSKVLPDTRTSQLVVVATEAEQSTVDTLVGQLDAPTRQVLIETRFVEISSSPQSRKGLDWSGTLEAQNISYGNGLLDTASRTLTSIPGTPVTTTFGGHTITTTPGSSSQTTLSTVPGNGLALNTASGLTPNIGFLSADGLHAVLSFLNSSADAQVVSTPRIVTLDNETANIEVTRGYPVINVTAGTANNSGGSTIAYTNVGTVLQVTPRISANDYIWLKVVPEVSTFAGTFQQSASSGQVGQQVQIYTAPLFDVRKIETQVLIPNANTLVMGGLVKDNPVSQTTKVPVLGDVPLLGYAFRSQIKNLDKDNLLIFITPTIVKDTDFQPAATDFLKTRPDTKRPALLNPNSAWDSTKPYDWSNPFKKSSPANSQTDAQP